MRGMNSKAKIAAPEVASRWRAVGSPSGQHVGLRGDGRGALGDHRTGLHVGGVVVASPVAGTVLDDNGEPVLDQRSSCRRHERHAALMLRGLTRYPDRCDGHARLSCPPAGQPTRR